MGKTKKWWPGEPKNEEERARYRAWAAAELYGPGATERTYARWRKSEKK